MGQQTLELDFTIPPLDGDEDERSQQQQGLLLSQLPSSSSAASAAAAAPNRRRLWQLWWGRGKKQQPSAAQPSESTPTPDRKDGGGGEEERWCSHRSASTSAAVADDEDVFEAIAPSSSSRWKALKKRWNKGHSDSQSPDIRRSSGSGSNKHRWLPSLAKALLLVPLRVAGSPLKAARWVGPPIMASAFCAFLPGLPSVLLGVVCVGGAGKVWGIRLLPAWGPARTVLGPLAGPLAAFGVMRVVMPHTNPGVWRGLQYWQRSLPVVWRYYATARRAKQLRRQGRDVEAGALWSARHAEGADEVFEVLCDLKGFYMKLGQILATKTDMLPPAYTSSLARLCDRLPPIPFSKVAAVLERELGGPLPMFLSHVDAFPLASATIAQVHRGVTTPGPAGPAQRVALKVQHPGVKRMMRADLANMKLFVDLADLFHMEFGFDLGSIVREYHVCVPLECDFTREAACLRAVAESLRARSVEMPLLQRVVVPQLVPHLCTERVLAMELLEGVPLLDCVGLEPSTKSHLMSALVLAFGVQVLLDGLFHTDPHPGNLMAVCRQGGDVQIALLDFGQMKSLTKAERVRASLMVVALASRDPELVRATMSELGVRIERCSPEFEAVASYILFDTRMDMAEALQSPLDPAANEGWRTTRVPALPRDLFMIMRVVTLLRGVLASLAVHDVSSALIWRPLALQVLGELTHVERPLGLQLAGPLSSHLPSPPIPPTSGTSATAAAAATTQGYAGGAAAGSGASTTHQGQELLSPPRRYRTPSPYRTRPSSNLSPPWPSGADGAQEGAADSVVVVGRRVRVEAEVAVVHGALSPRITSSSSAGGPFTSPAHPHVVPPLSPGRGQPATGSTQVLRRMDPGTPTRATASPTAATASLHSAAHGLVRNGQAPHNGGEAPARQPPTPPMWQVSNVLASAAAPAGTTTPAPGSPHALLAASQLLPLHREVTLLPTSKVAAAVAVAGPTAVAVPAAVGGLAAVAAVQVESPTSVRARSSPRARPRPTGTLTVNE